MPDPSPLEARIARSSSIWSDAWRRLRRNKGAMLGLAVILALFAVAILAPVIAPYPYQKVHFGNITEPPSAQFLLGTDSLGRDVLSRLIYGARVSLSVSIVAQLVILLIGVPVGMISAYYGGWVDTFIQRVVDVLYAFPSLLFIIVIMTYLKAAFKNAQGGLAGLLGALNKTTGGLMGVFLGLGLVFWLTVSRLVRAEVLSIKQKEYIEATRCIGVPPHRIMWRHILPNVLAPIVISVTFGIPSAITMEAGLSFLGLGVEPPTPSWGIMIAEGVRNIRSYPHLLLSSGLVLSVTLLAFNFLGDGLRDALDPYMKR
jgi:oligopeptide transport system permease protein